MLSDGAFKLFAYVSLEADRRTGRYEATQTDLVVLFISIAIFDFNPKVRNATLFG